MLQQQAPQRESDSGERREVGEQQHALRADRPQMTAGRHAGEHQQRSADAKLPAGHHRDVDRLADALAVDRGQREHHRGDDDEALAEQADIEIEPSGERLTAMTLAKPSRSRAHAAR